MAVDPGQVAAAEPQGTEVSDAPSSDQGGGALGWFRSFLGLDKEPSAPAAEADQGAEQQPEPASPEDDRVTLTQAELREQIRREAQSMKDREILADRRSDAVRRADAGDLEGLVELARKHGDTRFAEAELAKRGATYEAGQLVVDRQQAEQRWEAEAAPIRTLAEQFDQQIIDPVLMALPADARAEVLKIDGSGIEGRRAVVEAGLKALERHYTDQAMEKLRRDPVFRKELRIEMRATPAEYDEPDLVLAAGGAGRADGDTWLRSRLAS